MPRTVARINFSTVGGEEYSGYDKIHPGHTTNQPVGVLEDLLARWVFPPDDGHDRDSVNSEDERYDSNAEHDNGVGSTAARFTISGLAEQRYQARLVMGDPTASSVNKAKIGSATGSLVVFDNVVKGINQFCDAWTDWEVTSNGYLTVEIGGGQYVGSNSFLAFMEVRDPLQASTEALVEAIQDQLEEVPYIGPVYTSVKGFSDQGAIRGAGKITLADGTERLRVVWIEHTLERRGLTNATYEVVHAIRIGVHQALSTEVNAGDPSSEREMRVLADAAVVKLQDMRANGPLGTAVGAGWLGLTDATPIRFENFGVVKFGGDSWSRAEIAFQVSEEIDFE